MTRKRSLTTSPGNVLRTFSEDEAVQLSKDWLSVFGKNRNGVNSESFLWHIFSGGRYPSLEQDEALHAYDKQPELEVIALSNDRRQALLVDQRPTTSSLSDFYVFPPSFAWTMAFTHEAGWLGPYFAQHPDYVDLNRKAQEKEFARQKGWG